MARKPKVKQPTGAHFDALVDVYTKLIPIEDRKKRLLGNLTADHGGREASAIDEAAYAEAARRLAAPKTPPPSDAPGFEGTPMGALLGEAA